MCFILYYSVFTPKEYIIGGIENNKKGVTINGRVINNIRYTDGMVPLVCNQQQLQSLIDAVVEI